MGNSVLTVSAGNQTTGRWMEWAPTLGSVQLLSRGTVLEVRLVRSVFSVEHIVWYRWTLSRSSVSKLQRMRRNLDAARGGRFQFSPVRVRISGTGRCSTT